MGIGISEGTATVAVAAVGAAIASLVFFESPLETQDLAGLPSEDAIAIVDEDPCCMFLHFVVFFDIPEKEPSFRIPIQQSQIAVESQFIVIGEAFDLWVLSELKLS